MSTLDIPVDIETSFISINLNSSILFVFLGGMYTVLYFGTVYVYYTKNSSKHHLVPAAITILYLSIIALVALQWYITKWEFVDNGDTRQSVFLAMSSDGVLWMALAQTVLNIVSFTIADGLLIWRCFHVWNRSWPIVSVLFALIIAEIVLYFVYLALEVKSISGLTTAAAANLEHILAAAFFVSFGTTLVTTVLIAYRIYSVLNEEGASSRRFKHVIDIVVQSGAVYALSQFIAAMSLVFPALSFISNARGAAFVIYMEILNAAIAGISTTVMVARVALLSADTTYLSTSVHLSGLQFRARSPHPTSNMVELAPSINGDGSSPGEGQTIEEKTVLNKA